MFESCRQFLLRQLRVGGFKILLTDVVTGPLVESLLPERELELAGVCMVLPLQQCAGQLQQLLE